MEQKELLNNNYYEKKNDFLRLFSQGANSTILANAFTIYSQAFKQLEMYLVNQKSLISDPNQQAIFENEVNFITTDFTNTTQEYILKTGKNSVFNTSEYKQVNLADQKNKFSLFKSKKSIPVVNAVPITPTDGNSGISVKSENTSDKSTPNVTVNINNSVTEGSTKFSEATPNTATTPISKQLSKRIMHPEYNLPFRIFLFVVVLGIIATLCYFAITYRTNVSHYAIVAADKIGKWFSQLYDLIKKHI